MNDLHLLAKLYPVERLTKEKADIERTLEAYSTTITLKIDSKNEKALSYYMVQSTELNSRYKSQKALLQEKYDAFMKAHEESLKILEEKFDTTNKYYESEIKRLNTSQAVPEPERIVKAKMRLREIDSSLKAAEMNEESAKIVSKPGYILQHQPKLIPWNEIEMPREKELEELINKARGEEANLPPRKMKLPKVAKRGGESSGDPPPIN